MEYFDHYSACTSAEAKKEFFLTTADLRGVQYRSDYLGFGMGPPVKWYDRSVLEKVATAKHGPAGLAKKRAARKKREENKRRKELEAEKAKEELMSQSSKSVSDTPAVTAVESSSKENTKNASVTVLPSKKSSTKTVTPTKDYDTATNSQSPGPKVADPKEIKKLQTSIVKALRGNVTYDYMRQKRMKDWCPVSVEIPRVTMAEYAALIGRPTDVTLKSVVKSGAWYRESAPFETVLDREEGISGTGGRYGCNNELVIDSDSDLSVRYKPSAETLVVEATIQHWEMLD